MADGRQVIARQATTLQFWLGDRLVPRQFVVTELPKKFDAILGTPFLKEYNPNIDWNLGIISMPNSQVKPFAIVQSQTADVEIVSAKNARQINKTRTQILKNSEYNDGTNYFCAKLLQLDHIDYDQPNNVESLSSIDENPLSIQEQIDNIHKPR